MSSNNVFVDNTDPCEDLISPEPQIPVKKQNSKSNNSDFKFKEPTVRPTNDVSDEDKSDKIEAPKKQDDPKEQQSLSQSDGNKKKRKKRRDVIFKTILRECRRFYQIQLSDLTGFISSKKPRGDDYMYT